MSPEGKIEEWHVLMEEHEKSKKELLKEGYFDLTDEELDFIKDIPEEKRYDAIISRRHQDVLKAAYENKLESDRKNRKPKESKNKKKMIKASRRKNRKNR